MILAASLHLLTALAISGVAESYYSIIGLVAIFFCICNSYRSHGSCSGNRQTRQESCMVISLLEKGQQTTQDLSYICCYHSHVHYVYGNIWFPIQNAYRTDNSTIRQYLTNRVHRLTNFTTTKRH